jgi:NADH-quinone oxidoreductase subunit L
MFLAMGVGAFGAGIFHLMTHAFFKACLFLGSGAVIHSMHGALHHAHSHDDAQDMRNMGGLKSKMPITYATFLLATLAIAGFPFLSGFFSKDEILWQAFSNPHHGSLNILLWGMGAAAAGLTAFYMFRLVFMTFWGECRITPKAKDHLHESPMVIVIPLIILAGLSVLGGYIGVPKVIGDLLGGMPNYFEHYLEPVFKYSEEYMAQHASHSGVHSVALEVGLMITSVLIAFTGIAVAYSLYVKNTGIPARFAAAFPALHRAVFNKWYIDELYDAIIVNPCKAFSQFLWKGFDVIIIDGAVNGVASTVMAFSGVLRLMQTGLLSNYAWSMAFGVVVMLSYFILN